MSTQAILRNRRIRLFGVTELKPGAIEKEEPPQSDLRSSSSPCCSSLGILGLARGAIHIKPHIAIQAKTRIYRLIGPSSRKA